MPPPRPALLARRVVLSACLVLAAAACGSDGEGGANRDGDRTLTIVATPWPLQWLAEQVAPEAAVIGLGQAGVDPHELDLRPAEREALERADAILYLGPIGFQPHIEQAAAQRGDVAVAVTEAAGELLLHGDGHAHDGEERDEHAAEQVDPHVWFDPRTLAPAADALGSLLAELDPAHAAGYRARSADLAGMLAGLHGELDAVLSDCRHHTALVGHEAFAYLLERRGLEQVGVSGVDGHSEPSPAHMAELAELVEDEGIRMVLAEPVEGREAAEALAREAGVQLGEVDTLEAPDAERAARGYPDLLREQAAVFAQALECAG